MRELRALQAAPRIGGTSGRQATTVSPVGAPFDWTIVLTGASKPNREHRVRKTILLSTLVLTAGAIAAPPAHGQVSLTLHLGRPIGLTVYDPGYYGDWHTAYRTWTPVTVYYYDGNYYPRYIRGGRAVQVYRRGSEYFLPPREPAWENRGDRRYNYKRKPNDDDYQHAKPAPQGRGRGRGHG